MSRSSDGPQNDVTGMLALRMELGVRCPRTVRGWLAMRLWVIAEWLGAEPFAEPRIDRKGTVMPEGVTVRLGGSDASAILHPRRPPTGPVS